MLFCFSEQLTKGRQWTVFFISRMRFVSPLIVTSLYLPVTATNEPEQFVILFYCHYFIATYQGNVLSVQRVNTV